MDEFQHALKHLAKGEDSKDFRTALLNLCWHGVSNAHGWIHSPTKCTAKILFPERFYLPFSKIHDQIFDIVDSDLMLFVILAPRGFGKTSLLNLAYPARRILFRDTTFHVPIGNSATNAQLQSENLKRELLNNNMIKKLFGPMKTDVFSKEQWITESKTMVMPRGRGQPVRGLLHGDDRPQTVLGDDIEDAEEVRNEIRRADTLEWWLADVCNSINRARTDWRIGIIGTLLHEDSLLANLRDDPDWEDVTLSICDDNYVSNWPDFINDAEVKKLAEGFRRQGKLDVFYREYRNIPTSTEDASFSADNFQYYSETDEEFVEQIPDIENVVIVDPSKTAKMQSDDSAIVGLGINLKLRRVYIRDVIAGKMFPDELYDAALDMGLRFRLNGGFCRTIGLETIGIHDHILKPFKDRMTARALAFNIVELKAEGASGNVEKKDMRIGALAPYYRMGWMFHNSSGCCNRLEAQLLSFPRSKLRDIMDALAYFIFLMENGKLFFRADPTEQELLEQEKDQYGDSEYYEDDEDLPVLEDWRLIE